MGGDYYDFALLPKKEGLVIAIGDATGHGLRAGFLAAMVKAYFTLLAPKVTPIHLLQIISNRLAEMKMKQMYMGLTVVCFEKAHDHYIYASAGMPALRIYRAATKQVEVLTKPAMYLGTPLALRLKMDTFKLAHGDVLMLASDGLMEARNTKVQLLPSAMIDAEFIKVAHLPPAAIIEAMHNLQVQWQGKEIPDDDTTLVVVARR